MPTHHHVDVSFDDLLATLEPMGGFDGLLLLLPVFVTDPGAAAALEAYVRRVVHAREPVSVRLELADGTCYSACIVGAKP